MRKMLERITDWLIVIIETAIDLFTVLFLLGFVVLVPLSLVCVIVAFVCGA